MSSELTEIAAAATTATTTAIKMEMAAAPEDHASPSSPPSLSPEAEDRATIVTEDLQALLTRLQLRFVHRSARTMWIGRQMRVSFELALTHLRINMHDLGSGDGSAQRLHHELAWTDVLGAHILTPDGEHVDAPLRASAVKPAATYLFGVFACPAKAKRKAKAKAKSALKKRRLLELFFQFEGAQMRDVEALRTWINFLADPRTASQRQKAQSVVALTPHDPLRAPRKFLVLVNPVGGAGKGAQTYANKAAPLFKYAGIDVRVETTARAGHATELVREMPLGVYDCVISVGGDGSLCEITQGLMARPDWNRAIRQPIGIIPGGSGNGLSHSILHQSCEKATPLNAAFTLAKGAPQDIDIASIRNGKDVMYSFLSLEWAAIADVDLLSERLRALGGLRFGVGFGHHIFFTKKEYPGTLWYLEDDDATAAREPPRYFDTHDPSSTAYPALDLIECSPDDHAALGGTWKEITGRFHLLWVMSITHAAGDALVAPDAKFDDGYNYITYIDGAAHPRSELLSVLLAMEDGSHVQRASVKQLRTRAYKLVPERPTDALCVDGELFEGPTLECQVHRGLGRVMALPRAVE